MRVIFIRIMVALTFGVFIWLVPNIATPHCDTLEGPVIKDAKLALEKGDITPVLKWVKKEYEAEVKEAFKKTLIVRNQSKEAKELADMYFFETLVRVHRAGEGAPYTGLKSEKPEPIIVEADKALETGAVEALIKKITNLVAEGIKERFAQTKEYKKNIDASVEAGRKFVEAYVEFTHYVEKLYMDAIMPAHGKTEGEKAKQHGHQW